MDIQAMEPPSRNVERSQRAYARLAGLMFLVVLGFDIASLAITSTIQGSGGFLDASRNITAWELLYRIGLLLGLAGSLATILLAVALYIATARRARPGAIGGKPAEIYRAESMWKCGSPVRSSQPMDQGAGEK